MIERIIGFSVRNMLIEDRKYCFRNPQSNP
jgi:hypothetical protein